MDYAHHIQLILDSSHHDPFQVMGYHEWQDQNTTMCAIRAFHPDAAGMQVVFDHHTVYDMYKIRDAGFFHVEFPKFEHQFYQFRISNHQGYSWLEKDPYRHHPFISDYDLHLFVEGNHHHVYKVLGAHYGEFEGLHGVKYAVWAPNALRVSVIGDFNNWDGRRHPMRNRGYSGIFELFIPDHAPGHYYKFEIKTHRGEILVKTDPYGFQFEERPKTASIVTEMSNYPWMDEGWMKTRYRHNNHEAPVSIYELHLSSWRRIPQEGNRPLSYREMADELIPYVKWLGFTHIELMPVMEHPFDGSWGYQVTGFFAPTSRFGTPYDFKYFVDRCHQEGLGVILDWVPGHFPKDAFALAKFDGTALYEHADPRLGEHMDWGTLIFNYGRKEVRNFLIASGLFWLEEYHIDGLRVDAVASMLYLDYSRKEGEWLPNQYGGRENLDAIEFLKSFNSIVYHYYPDTFTAAEESTSFPAVSKPVYNGGLGFGYKWNMGWMHDFLNYMSYEPIYRKYHHNELTFSLLYSFSENFILPLSHDEVVHGKCSLLSKMPGDDWQKLANLRLLYGFMFGHPGKKLLFMGQEFGQWNEWNHSESVDWHLNDYSPHRGIQLWLRDLNQHYKQCQALHQVDFAHHGFEWVDCNDVDNSIVSFLRWSKNYETFIIGIFNFTPVPRYQYRVGVPFNGFYKEVLNSDSVLYGGSNIGNLGGIHSDAIHWMNRPHSVKINLPPLGAVFLELNP